jgi:hypothetical protein
VKLVFYREIPATHIFSVLKLIRKAKTYFIMMDFSSLELTEISPLETLVFHRYSDRWESDELRNAEHFWFVKNA